MWRKILCENMKRMLVSFCIEAIFILAEGEGERKEDGSFMELEYMKQVIDTLYARREELYLILDVENSIERYYELFNRIYSTPKECNFTYYD